MTDPQIAIMMLVLFIIIVLLGFPIAFTLIAMGLGFGSITPKPTLGSTVFMCHRMLLGL